MYVALQSFFDIFQRLWTKRAGAGSKGFDSGPRAGERGLPADCVGPARGAEHPDHRAPAPPAGVRLRAGPCDGQLSTILHCSLYLRNEIDASRFSATEQSFASPPLISLFQYIPSQTEAKRRVEAACWGFMLVPVGEAIGVAV